MKITYAKMEELIRVLEGVKDMKMPFKLSIIFAKNLKNLKKEEEFYIEQERKFAKDYLVFKEDGSLETQGPNVYKIQEGKEAECEEARKAIDTFEADIDLIKIPVKDVEKLEFTPAELETLMDLIEEE